MTGCLAFFQGMPCHSAAVQADLQPLKRPAGKGWHMAGTLCCTPGPSGTPTYLLAMQNFVSRFKVNTSATLQSTLLMVTCWCRVPGAGLHAIGQSCRMVASPGCQCDAPACGGRDALCHPPPPLRAVAAVQAANAPQYPQPPQRTATESEGCHTAFLS